MLGLFKVSAGLLPAYSQEQSRELGLRTTATAITRAARGPRLLQVQDSLSLAATGRLTARVGAISQTAKNVGRISTLLQVAEQGLSAIGEKLERMETLAQEARSANSSVVERARLNAEFEELRADIDEIAEETTFDDLGLLTGGDGGQSTLTLSQEFGASGLGSDLGDDDGFETFLFAAEPSGVSDGDTIRVEYTASTGVFTATNTTTGEVATGLGPDETPSSGEFAYVNLADFGLTIELNESFDPGQDKTADAGDPSPSEFTVSVASVPDATTSLSSSLAFDAALGVGGGALNTVTVTLDPATVADLAPGLVFDGIASRSGAGRALANVAAAKSQLGELQAQIAGALERFGAAAQRLDADADILGRDRTALLTPQDSFDLANRISAKVLEDAAPMLSALALESARGLLAALAAGPPAPRPDPVEEPAGDSPSQPSLGAEAPREPPKSGQGNPPPAAAKPRAPSKASANPAAATA